MIVPGPTLLVPHAQLVQLAVELRFLLVDLLELLSHDAAGLVGLLIESLEVEHDGADVFLQVDPHFLLPLQLHLVLVDLLNQFLLLLAGQVVDVALYLLNPPRYLDLQLPVLILEVDQFHLQVGYLVPVLYLLQVQVLDGDVLVEGLHQHLLLLADVLVGRVEGQGVVEFADLYLQILYLLVDVHHQLLDCLVTDRIVLLCYCLLGYLVLHLRYQTPTDLVALASFGLLPLHPLLAQPRSGLSLLVGSLCLLRLLDLHRALNRRLLGPFVLGLGAEGTGGQKSFILLLLRGNGVGFEGEQFRQLLIIPPVVHNEYIIIKGAIEIMFRKIQTSKSRRKFLHEQAPQAFPSCNNITRPPTSHPYSALRNMRSQESLQYNKYGFDESFRERDETAKENKIEEIAFESKFKDVTIPKVYVHLLTEIKIMFRGREQKQAKQINCLLGNLSKKISEMYKQGLAQRAKLEEVEKQVLALGEKNDELNRRLKKNESPNTPPLNGSSKGVGKNGNYGLLVENVKLAQLNATYLARIAELEEGRKEEEVEEAKKESQEVENTEVLRYHNRIAYLEMKLKSAGQKEQQLSGEIERLELANRDLKQEIKFNEREKGQIQERLGEWRQRARMQLEDSQMHLTRQNFLLFSIKKLRELNKNLTDKLINQGSSEAGALRQEIQPNPYFQYEVDFFKNIKSVYKQSKGKEMRIQMGSALDSSQPQKFEKEEEYAEYRKYQEVNLSTFTYYCPSFHSFIQQSLTSDISATRNRNNSSVSRIFMQILRAILNSKLNQFLMLPEENYSRFPEFVYTWFERFYFNTEQQEIATLEPYMQKPFPQDVFYRDLMNIRLDQSWEIITFREFLLEQLSLEELYFYLMCQNLLFRRGSVTKAKQYQGDFCILVEYSAAKAVLDLVLSDFESWNLTYLTSKLREKVIYKKNVEFIESGFFLRCLVEYYKIERVNRYKYISKLCLEFKSEEKGLRFSSFISVINRFTEVSVQQKIRLYRECFCVGKGRITGEVIFTVCSEQLIFLKYLKLKCFYRLPLMTSQKSFKPAVKNTQEKSKKSTAKGKSPNIICLQPPDPYLYQIFSRMIPLVESGSSFVSQLERMGLVDLLNQLGVMQKIFNSKLSNTDSSQLRCRHFMHFLSQLLNKVRVINFNSFYQLLEEQAKKRNNESYWVDIDEAEVCAILAEEFTATLSINRKLQEYLEWRRKVYDFRVNHAARKIQRMVRKKFIAPFLQLYKIMYSQLRAEEVPRK